MSTPRTAQSTIQDIERQGDEVQQARFRQGIWQPWMITGSGVLFSAMVALSGASAIAVILSMLFMLLFIAQGWKNHVLEAAHAAAESKLAHALSCLDEQTEEHFEEAADSAESLTKEDEDKDKDKDK